MIFPRRQESYFAAERLPFRGRIWMNPLFEKQAEASFHDGDGVSHHHQLKQVAKRGGAG